MKYIFSLVLILSLNFASAQKAVITISDNGMACVSPEQLTKAVSSLGLKIDYPVALDLSLSEEQYETINGIDTREVFNSNLNIQYNDLITGKTLSSHDYQLLGSAKNKRVLYKGLAQAVRKKKKQIQKHLNESLKDRSALSCAEAIAGMKKCQIAGDFQIALELSQYAPENCPQIDDLKGEIYSYYQDAYCSAHLVKVKAYIAVDDFTNAAREIIKVDPDSDCSEELLPLIKQLDGEVEKESENYFEAYLEYVKSEDRTKSDFRSRLIDILILK